MASNSNFTVADVETAFAIDPSLRDRMIKALNQGAENLLSSSKALSGGKRGGRRAASATAAPSGGKAGTHPAVILQVLAGVKDGLKSRDIRKAASQLGHEFGNSLGTTLNNMCTDGRLDYAQAKDSQQFIYKVGKAAK